MNYGYIKNGEIKAPVAMCSVFEGIGAWHTLTDQERAVHGWYRCEVVNESVDPLTQSRSDFPELSFDGEKITAAYTVIEKSLETVRFERLMDLATYRFGIEVGGLSLDGGVKILTDRESQSQLSNAYVTLKHGLIPDTDWKAANGWQLVELEQIEPIARAVAAHRRGCFRGERVVQGLLNEAQTIADLGGIDIRAKFQAAYQAAYSQVMGAV